MRRLHISTVNLFSDTDTVLLHAAFKLLCDFIEKEKPEELIGSDLQYDGAEEQNDDLRRLRCLYYWWRYIRPKQQDSHLLSHTKNNHVINYEFDTDRLHELISLRENMWT